MAIFFLLQELSSGYSGYPPCYGEGPTLNPEAEKEQREGERREEKVFYTLVILVFFFSGESSLRVHLLSYEGDPMLDVGAPEEGESVKEDGEGTFTGGCFAFSFFWWE